MTRGEVVIVQFPYAGGGQGKNRPALVVQNDRDNRRLSNTVVAMISGNTQHAAEPTQVFIDPNTPDGASSRHAFMYRRSSNAAILSRFGNRMLSKRSGDFLIRCSRKWTAH